MSDLGYDEDLDVLTGQPGEELVPMSSLAPPERLMSLPEDGPLASMPQEAQNAPLERQSSPPPRMRPRVPEEVPEEPILGKVEGKGETPLRGLDEVFQTREQGALDRGKTSQYAQNQFADILNRWNQSETESIQQFQQQYEAFQAREEQALAEVQRRTTELFNTRFEANRLFNGMSGADRFGLGLGVAVGSVIQTILNTTFPGANTPNLALRMVDDMVERDIQEQVQNFNQRTTAVDASRSAFALARQVGLDEREAMDFIRAKQKEQVATELSVVARRYQGTLAGQQAEDMAAQIRGQAESLRLQTQAAAMQSTARRRREPEQPNRISIMGYRQVPGSAPVSDTDLRQAAEQVNAFRLVRTNIDALLALLNERTLATRANWGSVAAKARTLETSLKMEVIRGSGLGAYDTGLANLLSALVGDSLTSVTAASDSVRTSLLTLRGLADYQEQQAAGTVNQVRPENPVITPEQRASTPAELAIESARGALLDTSPHTTGDVAEQRIPTDMRIPRSAFEYRRGED